MNNIQNTFDKHLCCMCHENNLNKVFLTIYTIEVYSAHFNSSNRSILLSLPIYLHNKTILTVHLFYHNAKIRIFNN